MRWLFIFGKGGSNLNVLKKVFLILLTLILVISIPVAIFLNSLSTTIVEPYRSISYIEQSGIYDGLEKAIKAEMENYQVGSEEIGSEITNTIVNRVVNEIVTSEWLASKSAILQTNLWDYILGKTNSIYPISFQDFWQSFMIVTEEELSKYTDSKLPNELLNNSIAKGFEERLPQELDIMNTYGIKYSDLDLVKKYYNLGIKALYIVYSTIIISIFLGILLLIKSRKALKWLGAIFITSSLISFIPIGLKQLYQDELLTNINLSGILVNFEDGLFKLFNLVVLDITDSILLYSIIVLLIGISLLIFDINNNKIGLKQQRTIEK